MFWLIAIDFSQKSPYFSLLSPTSPCELSEREVTSPSNLKVVRALDNYSLVFVIFINFFRQLKDWVGQVLLLVSCPKGQVEKYVNVEAWFAGGIIIKWGINYLTFRVGTMFFPWARKCFHANQKSNYFHFGTWNPLKVKWLLPKFEYDACHCSQELNRVYNTFSF